MAKPFAAMLRAHWLVDAFLIVIGGIPTALALTFLGMPDVYAAVRGFRSTFQMLDPWIWAVMLLIPAVWVFVATFLDRRVAMIPCQIIAIVFVLFGVSLLPTVKVGVGVPSGAIVYSGLGFLSSLTGLLAWTWDDLRRNGARQ